MAETINEFQSKTLPCARLTTYKNVCPFKEKKKNTLKSPPHQHLSSKLPLINVIQRHLTPKLAYFRKRKYRVLQDTHDKAIGLMSQFIACSFFCPFLFSHLSCSPSVKTTVSDNVAAYINLYKGKDHFTQVSLKKISSWSFCLFFFFF